MRVSHLVVMSFFAMVLTSVATTGSFGQSAPADGSTALMLANYPITGTILDSTGKPAANIDVKLLQATGKGGPVKRGPNDSPTGDASFAPSPNELQDTGTDKVLKTAKTDSSGRFTFPDNPPGTYVVLAGDDKSSIRGRVTVRANRAPPSVRLQLPATK